jgi:2-oxoisovalerate dehydrogenase E1 component beta subunit
MAMKTLIEALRDGMAEEMRRDQSIIVMGEDVGLRGGVFLATDGLYKEFGELRVIDTPLAESSIIGVAMGAAINGMRPIAEIQFADFSHPGMNQIMNEVAKLRYRSSGDYSCPMVIRMPYGGGVHGGLYHSQCVEALYAHIPGLKVVAPCTPYDTKGLIKAAIRDDDPVIFLEHKKTYRSAKGDVPDQEYVVPIGKADVKRQGEQLTVISYGMVLHYCLEAAETMAGEGVTVEVVDLRTLVPLDKETILASVQKTGKVLIAYEDNKAGGFGAEVSATIAEEAFESLDAPIMRLAGPDTPAVPFNPVQEEWFMLSTAKVLAAMRKLAHY